MPQEQLATAEPQQLAAPRAATQLTPVVNPETLILTALEKGVPVETMERLLAMRDKLVAEQARNAFFRDLAEFQMQCPVIVKDKDVLNKDGRTVRYRYAPLDSIVRQIRGTLAEFGFSYQFTTSAENDSVSVTCHARHRDGHTETTTFVSKIDPQAFMNLAQKFGSALTFGKRYAFLAAFGIMTGDEDDDSQSTSETAGQKTAREKLADIKRHREKIERENEPEPPVYHQSEETAEETADIGILTDFLTGVAESEDVDELTAMWRQSGEFQGAARNTAKQAVKEKAIALGFVWQGGKDGEFVKGGAK
jgi:hypothetical protein